MHANFSLLDHGPVKSRRPAWSEVAQNRIIALVLVMIVAVPLLAAPADRNLTGIAAITLESFSLLLITALLWRAQWNLRADNVQRFLKTGANLPIIGLLALMTLSCIFSPSKLFSIQELLRTGSGMLLYFVVAYHFRQSKHLTWLVNVILTLAALVALGGMAQYQLGSEERADAMFGNPQPLASFVMLMLPVVAALAWTDKSSNRRITAMIISVVMVGCLMLTQGRSAWMGAGAGLLMLAYLATRPVGTQTKNSKLALSARKHQFVWPVVVVLIVAGFLAITKSQNNSIDARAATSNNLAADGSWQWRLQVWEGALRMIEVKPLTGWGTGLYPLYQKQFTDQGAKIAPDGSGIRVSLAEQAHNFYLQTAAELGLPGLLLTLAAFICFLNAGLRRVRQLEPGIRRTLLIGTLSATTAFLVDAVASPSWQYGQTAMFLWLILGMGTSCLRPRVKREDGAVIHVPSRRFALVSRPMAAGVFLVCLTLLPTAYSSAQSFDYNTGSDGVNTGQVIFGVTAVAGLLWFLSDLGDSATSTGSGGTIIIAAPTPTPTPTPAPTAIPIAPGTF